MTEALHFDRTLPVAAKGRNSVGWWGMLCLIATEGSLFAYLLFSYYYIAAQQGPGWSPEPHPSLAVALLGWRATQAEKSGGAESALQTGEGRSRFMAAAGMLSAAGFVIAILFNLAEYAFTPGCAGMPS